MQHCLASVLHQDARPCCSSPWHLTGSPSASAPGLALPTGPACSAAACSGPRLGSGGISSCGGSAATTRHSTADGPLAWHIGAGAPGPLAGPAAWLTAAQLIGDGNGNGVGAGEAAGHSAGEQVPPGTAPVMEPVQPATYLPALDAPAAGSQQSDERDAALRGEQRRRNMATVSVNCPLLAGCWAPSVAVLAAGGFDDRCIHLMRCLYKWLSA